MRAEIRRGLMVVAALVVAGLGCENTTAPGSSIDGPTELSAEAVGTTTVRVSWKAVDGNDVAGYELERRSDLQGAFEVIEGSVPPIAASRVAWLDTKVAPNTYYGYRVRAVSRLGGKSAVSNIAGTKTASMPGLMIHTSTQFPNAESADPDGYTAVVRGARDTQSVAIGITGDRLVPVSRGTYSVALRGLSANCATATASDSVKQVTVTDEGTHTVTGVSFTVSCRDPKKASIVVAHQIAGDTVDADGFAVTVSGIVMEPGTPANERVYFETRTVVGSSGSTRFDNLRLGDYEVSIADVESPCTLNGAAKQTLQPHALAVDTVRFALTCRKPIIIDTVGKPFILKSSWSVASARPGDKVFLLTALDMRAQPTQEVSGVSADITFDNAVVRYDSARTTGTFDFVTIGRSAATVIGVASANTDGSGETGNIQIVRTWFTVIGAAGSSVRTSTALTEVLTPALDLLNSKVRVEDATLTISSTGGPANQPPTATITAPATATVGTAVAFSGSPSRDTDGTIASYAWNFGDNASSTGVSTSHTYSSAGSYTIRLTVTDNAGATASIDHAIVVSAVSATTGTIAGTVISGGTPLAGVTVSVTGGGTATSTATGAYSIANVATGSRTVTVTTVPASCTAPTARTVNVTAGTTTTLNLTVTCTTAPQLGTIAGKVTRASDATGIAGVSVLVQPTGGAALAAVVTSADGSYTVSGVPIGTGTSAGAGVISLSNLPSSCANPGSQSYTGLTVGGSVTKDVTITCGAATLGTLAGTITRSGGGALAGVQVTLTPATGTAPAPVTTDASGAYTIAGVALGDGTITLSGLAAGCTNPGVENYSGVTSGGTVTKNIVVTCSVVGGPHTYPFSATWGAITNTGPTGRQVTLTFAIDMGAAPGRSDIDGANADPLAGISFSVAYNGTLLDYTSRVLLPPGGEFDLAIVNETHAGTTGAQAAVAIASTSGQTVTGNVQLLRLSFNVATGSSGAVAPTVTLTEALATNSLTDVTSSVTMPTLPALTIP